MFPSPMRIYGRSDVVMVLLLGINYGFPSPMRIYGRSDKRADAPKPNARIVSVPDEDLRPF